LTAGNLLAAYKSKNISGVRGALRLLPASGVLWIVGFLAVSGLPPFGVFLSEFTILKAAFDTGHDWLGWLYLALLGGVFIGLATAFLGMAQGNPETPRPPLPEAPWAIWPPAALAGLVLMLGLYIPPPLQTLLRAAARPLGGL